MRPATGRAEADWLALAGAMADALMTRGPDARGVWADAAEGIALAHRRLSILDLSAEGSQPMHSASARYVISFNGEIYNYGALKAQLAGPWRGTSDTEVLLAAFESWGIEKTLQKADGMFAIALWDRQQRQLTLARDRMGEKPLYYGQVVGSWAFASELKAFRALPGWPPSICRDALHQYMRYGYIAAPHTIYKGIAKLLPGHFVTLRPGNPEAVPQAYWSLEQMVGQSAASRFAGTEQQAADRLEELLKKAVAERMVADVPLGAFLSGGIDSSSLVALMQAQSARPVKTFTIGFSEAGFDEAPYAKAVAGHLGTDHTEIYISPKETAAVIPKLPTIYDEPFADSSQIPTFLVSQFARQQVTVALSGDGGDEFFGGYNRHRIGPLLWQIFGWMPGQMKAGLGQLQQWLGTEGSSRLARLNRKAMPYYEKLMASDSAAFYKLLCSAHHDPSALLMAGEEKPLPTYGAGLGLGYAEWMMLQDALTYFPNDILTKVDRAAMAVSLETRTPFTDPDVMAFAWQLPLTMKIRGGKGKWLLRQVLYRYVPEALIERPKAGFAVPIGEWLRGPLKPWAEALLEPQRLSREGYFQPEAVAQIWHMHQSRTRDMEHQLWSILMFQSWLESK